MTKFRAFQDAVTPKGNLPEIVATLSFGAVNDFPAAAHASTAAQHSPPSVQSRAYPRARWQAGGTRELAIRCLMVASVASVLGACAVTPSARYSIIRSPDQLGTVADTFYLQQSVLKIELTEKEAARDKPASYAISVTSAPTEYRELKIGIEPKGDWLTKSSVSLVKQENTGLIKSAAVDIADYRIETINKIGGLIVKGVGLSATGEALERDSFPVVTNVTAFLRANGSKPEAFTIDANSNGGVTVELSGVGPSAIAIDALPATWLTSLPYAACREAKVSFQYKDPLHLDQTTARVLTYETRVHVADPFFVELAPFPSKGQVNFHSECGVSVVPGSAQASPGLGIAEALLTQAIAIDKALNSEESKEGQK